MSCHGSRQKWKFNDGELPEDVIKLRDQSLNIKNITRKHRGLYTCSGHQSQYVDFTASIAITVEGIEVVYTFVIFYVKV